MLARWTKLVRRNDTGYWWTDVFNCWGWNARDNGNGYGVISTGYRGSVKVYAYRLAYMLFFGKIPDMMECDHLCNSRRCVNPLHIEIVTHQENMRRSQERRTTCKAGHPFNDTNTYWWCGERHCRACRMQHSTTRRLNAIK